MAIKRRVIKNGKVGHLVKVDESVRFVPMKYKKHRGPRPKNY